MRSSSGPLVRYTECHNDDITTLSFHPASSTTLLSGGTDALVNIYDLNITDEDDTLVQVINHGASVAHAVFLAAGEEEWVAVLSHDELCAVYARTSRQEEGNEEGEGVGEEGEKVEFGDLRGRLDCQYAIGLNRMAGWAVVGVGRHEESRVDLIPLRANGKEWSFQTGERIRLGGAHTGEIVRSFLIDDQTGTVFTGGEDGVIMAWKAENVSEGPGGGEVGPVRSKRKKGEGRSDRLFKPY